MRLSDLQTNEEGIITKVTGRGAFRKRITEMGFVRGKKIKVIKNAPLRDPIEYNILGYEISLRRSEASLIEVLSLDEARSMSSIPTNGSFTEEHLRTSADISGKSVRIALVGNPNSGKTTIFNLASGARERVGNYAGVTVDLKEASMDMHGYHFELVDLPGTYSISAYSPEELYVREYLMSELPDVVINVVDASNLERNLYLTTQLIDMDIKVIIALNMYDEYKQSGNLLNHRELGRMIGIPIVPTVASRGKGINQLFQKAIDVYTDSDTAQRHVHINHGKEIETSIRLIQDLIWENKSLTDRISSRFYAIKLLERDTATHEALSGLGNYSRIKETTEREIERIENLHKEEPETLITDSKYGFIHGALKETFQSNPQDKQHSSKLIDNFLTHRLAGFPLFFLFMFLTFFATFELGKYPVEWIEGAVSSFSVLISNLVPGGPLKDLLVDGIIGGVGSVIVFLPNILILFLFISFMEDTGYMARAAFIMDRVMHKIGLHGRSFIPLIMGFGCNVPAIMATRTIPDHKNRIVTVLINPFMSCSARLPVYILLIGAFFPKSPGLMLFLIYMIGILMAAIIGLLFKKTLFRSHEAPFVLELPPYRMPTVRSTIKHMWFKVYQYLKKMGGVILVASILIWALGYFPRNIELSKDYPGLISELSDNSTNENISNSGSEQTDNIEKIRLLQLEMEAEMQENSYIGRIGKFIEPAIKPLGFDWKMGVSLLTGVAAKEVVISTMGVLYQSDNGTRSSDLLVQKLRTESHPNGDLVFTPLVAFAFMMFILIYFPCVAVVAAVKKETGSWKWAAFLVIYTTGIAWLFAFLIYQLGSILG